MTTWRAFVVVALVLAGCRPGTRQSGAPPEMERHHAPARLVAVGDLHGNLAATRRALRLAGAVDDQDRWTGGNLVLVQTGDEIDRGAEDRAVVELLDALREQAQAAGGDVVTLLGNHEVLNAQGDFRYANPEATEALRPLAGAPGPRSAGLPVEAQARAEVFLPGGVLAQRLSRRPVVAVVDGTVFVHGGLLPEHLRYGVERMNKEVDAWMAGLGPPPPEDVVGRPGPLWTRLYAKGGPEVCGTLEQVLTQLGVKRMVVGHTIQEQGIRSACGDKVWFIDVALSDPEKGRTEVLALDGDQVRVLRAP